MKQATMEYMEVLAYVALAFLFGVAFPDFDIALFIAIMALIKAIQARGCQ